MPSLRRLSTATGQTTCFNIRLGWLTAKAAAVTGPRAPVYLGPVRTIARLDDDVGRRAIIASLPPPERATLATYVAKHGQPPGTVPRPEVTRVLLDRLARPVAVAFLDGQVEPRPGECNPWSAILEQLTAELSLFDHHFSHVTPAEPDLLNQLEQAHTLPP